MPGCQMHMLEGPVSHPSGRLRGPSLAGAAALRTRYNQCGMHLPAPYSAKAAERTFILFCFYLLPSHPRTQQWLTCHLAPQATCNDTSPSSHSSPPRIRQWSVTSPPMRQCLCPASCCLTHHSTTPSMISSSTCKHTWLLDTPCAHVTSEATTSLLRNHDRHGYTSSTPMRLCGVFCSSLACWKLLWASLCCQ
jgi:hypothetical protein